MMHLRQPNAKYRGHLHFQLIALNLEEKRFHVVVFVADET